MCDENVTGDWMPEDVLWKRLTVNLVFEIDNSIEKSPI